MKIKRHKNHSDLRDCLIMLHFLTMKNCEDSQLPSICSNCATYSEFFSITRRSIPSNLQCCHRFFPFVVLIYQSQFFCLLILFLPLQGILPLLCQFPKEGKNANSMKSTCYFIIRVTQLLVQYVPHTTQDFLRCVWRTGLISRPGQILCPSYY